MDIDRKKAQEIYSQVISEYENVLCGLTFSRFDIGQCEATYLIEDTFIIYVGLINFSSSEQFPMFSVVFEEFSYNELFKFNVSAFSRKFDVNIIKYHKYTGALGKPLHALTEWNGHSYEVSSVIVPSQFQKVCSLLPDLRIVERHDAWEGFLYIFIVYELIDHNKTGYAICYTNTPNPHTVAQRKGNDVEMSAIMYYPYYLKCGYVAEGQGHNNGVDCDTFMIELLIKRIEENKAEGWANRKVTQGSQRICLAERDLKYFIVPTYIKAKSDVYPTKQQIITNARNGLYAHVERHEYLIPENKWKSEQLVYELTKKLFKRKHVIYQHRPYFLRGNKGQLSYDVFVCGENIAIEYQGKQHFEPVEIFGGEKQFETQQERDQLKARLSEENGVKLVYVNYWEDISIELLKDKINAFEKAQAASVKSGEIPI